MPDSPVSVLGQSHFVGSDVLAEVASLASAVDCDSDADRRPILRRLADDQLLSLGLPSSPGTYLDQVLVLAEMGGACMTSAFSAWAHRMTVEYLGRFAPPQIAQWADDVARGRRPGSTALAATFRAAAGLEELPVTATRDEQNGQGRIRLNGFISWASNLYDDAIVVTGVQDGPTRRLVAFPLNADGVHVQSMRGLLALDASQSGALTLTEVEVKDDWFLDVEFSAFIAAVRPVFLAFQSAFCLGLAASSVAASQEPRGVAVSLLPRVEDSQVELSRLWNDLRVLAEWLDHRTGEVPVHPVKLRLDAAHLAVAATQLELAVRGGAAYRAQSPTARRVREALFLPVQSPTEAQLQWELQQSV